MLRLVLILLLGSMPAAAETLLLPEKEQSLGFKISDEELLQKYGIANDNCRGGNPNTLDMYLACANRDVLSEVMVQRDFCYGKKGDTASVQMYWHKCGPDSLKD